MNAKFVPSSDVERINLDWGVLGWLSRPATTGARNLTVIEVTSSQGMATTSTNTQTRKR